MAPPDELPTQPASPQPDLTPAPIAVPASPASPELASDALADSELAPQQARRTSSAGPATKPAVVGLAGLVKSSPTLDASPPAAEAASVPALEPVLAPGPSATKVPVFSAAEGGSRAGAAAPHPNATAAAVTPAAAAADQAAADEASAGTESGDLSQSIVAEGVKSMAALARAGAEASTMISKVGCLMCIASNPLNAMLIPSAAIHCGHVSFVHQGLLTQQPRFPRRPPATLPRLCAPSTTRWVQRVM